MPALFIVLGLLIVFFAMWDGFETVVVPRTVRRNIRVAPYFFRMTWILASWFTRHVKSAKAKDATLSAYGPFVLVLLVGVWAMLLMTGFALLQHGIGLAVNVPSKQHSLGSEFYLSGTTFFTLGMGDEKPVGALARAVTVFEAGIGFGFLAVIVGYLPVFYQAFSRRETSALLVTSRAGRVPSATGVLQKYANVSSEALREILEKWEDCTAELLENYISYPILAFYRSHQDRQSWLAALCIMLDTCSILQVALDEDEEGVDVQAELTYNMAVRVLVVISTISRLEISTGEHGRLTHSQFNRLAEEVSGPKLKLSSSDEAWTELKVLRASYEPYLVALSQALFLELPDFLAKGDEPSSSPEETVREAETIA